MLTSIIGFATGLLLVFTLIALLASGDMLRRKIYETQQLGASMLLFGLAAALQWVYHQGYPELQTEFILAVIVVFLGLCWKEVLTDRSNSITSWGLLFTCLSTVGWAIATIVTGLGHEPFWGFVFSLATGWCLFISMLTVIIKDYHHAES